MIPTRDALLLATVLLTAGVAHAEAPANLNPATAAGPTFIVRDGFAIVEAESVPASPRWELRNDPAEPGGCTRSRMDSAPTKPTGKGYLRWNGPSLTCKSQGKPEVKEEGPEKHGDLTQGCQGDRKDWLQFKLWVTNPGTYEVDLRSYHLKEDGDNDAWIGYFGQKGTILRQTNCKTKTYSWGNYTRQVPLVKGLNVVYVAGRSVGYGLDRIAIFQADKGELARDPKTPESARRSKK
jgi:hypothetical protein